MVIEPPVLGAVAVMLNDAVPALDKPLVRVTVQVRAAPAADGRLPQLTPDTPLPAVTAVATTPAGKASLIVAEVPLVAVPLLPKVRP